MTTNTFALAASTIAETIVDMINNDMPSMTLAAIADIPTACHITIAKKPEDYIITFRAKGCIRRDLIIHRGGAANQNIANFISCCILDCAASYLFNIHTGFSTYDLADFLSGDYSTVDDFVRAYCTK